MTSKYYVQKKYRTNGLSLMNFPNEVQIANRIYDSIKNLKAYYRAFTVEETDAESELETRFEKHQIEAEAFSMTTNHEDMSESDKLCLINRYKNRNSTNNREEKKEEYDYESEWHDEMYRKSKRRTNKATLRRAVI